MDDADGKAHATAWRRLVGVWEPSVLADTTSSWLSARVGTENGVMLFDTDGAASKASDLFTFASVDTLEEGMTPRAAMWRCQVATPPEERPGRRTTSARSSWGASGCAAGVAVPDIASVLAE